MNNEQNGASAGTIDTRLAELLLAHYAAADEIEVRETRQAIMDWHSAGVAAAYQRGRCDELAEVLRCKTLANDTALAAAREQALEEAVDACVKQNDTDWPTPLGCAHAIRALASQPATATQTDEQDAAPKKTNGDQTASDIETASGAMTDGSPATKIASASVDRDAPLRGAPAATEAVAVVDEADDGLFVEILYGPNGSSLKRGDKLFAAAAAPVAQAPSVQSIGYDALYKAWHKAGADIAGLRWDDFVAEIAAPVAAPTPVAAPVLTDADMDRLHSAIMNLRCDSAKYRMNPDQSRGYGLGHRDARHAAAELVAAAERQPQPADEFVRAGWFLYEGIEWTPTSGDDPRATILYRKAAIQQAQQAGKDGA